MQNAFECVYEILKELHEQGIIQSGPDEEAIRQVIRSAWQLEMGRRSPYLLAFINAQCGPNYDIIRNLMNQRGTGTLVSDTEKLKYLLLQLGRPETCGATKPPEERENEGEKGSSK